ncbi:unnamed protein product [Peronospora farinosa]|uniref:Ammonium transporter AmtB-like domain-containing protein n=1 Tax=Peronospora farinosa TaxID=134698 RepID=A0ABN8BSJ4_9STRA|nr:unnamed protein product [Peronospora farinosa]
MKNHLRYDDTLDSFAIHGCGGFMGGLMTGLFATSDVNPNIEGGAFYGHGMQVVHQLVSQCVAAAYSFVVTIIILGQDHTGPTVKAANPPVGDFAAMMSPRSVQEVAQKELIMNA